MFCLLQTVLGVSTHTAKCETLVSNVWHHICSIQLIQVPYVSDLSTTRRDIRMSIIICLILL
jgi:hypothetical protein